MRDALNLSEAQLGLVMSVYLLPAALAAVPLGVLADRIGRRIVFGGSFIGFGICGAVLPLVATSFQAFLAVRFVQGIMFAGLLPLTMTILGDFFSGAELVGAQGRRSVAMSMGDGLLPVMGGLLVGAGWFVPWLGQAIAIPLGSPFSCLSLTRRRSGPPGGSAQGFAIWATSSEASLSPRSSTWGS